MLETPVYGLQGVGIGLTCINSLTKEADVIPERKPTASVHKEPKEERQQFPGLANQQAGLKELQVRVTSVSRAG